jgi:hypothetical protein
VQFRVVYSHAADRGRVASVQWALDGEADKFRRGSGRDAYSFASFHLTEGAHVIDVTITPNGGEPVVGHIRFRATPCQPASFAASADHTKAPGHQPFAFWVFSGSAPLSGVELGATGARVSIASSLRGRKVGELRYGDTPAKPPLALRLPTRIPHPSAISLLRHGRLSVVLHPARRRFLTITGLPAIRMLNLSFGGPRTYGQLPADGAPTGPAAGVAGLIGAARRCGRPRWDAWARGVTGTAARMRSQNSVYRACRR